MEQYSIDEAFVPLAGSLAVNADDLALALRNRIRQWTGIAVSIGVGTTRTLARLASELAKKDRGVSNGSWNGIRSELTRTAT